MIDEELYRRAAEELDSGNRRAHLWARACSLASDDHDEARFLYTNLRVEELLEQQEETQFQDEQADDNSLSHIASVDNLELDPVEFDADAPARSGIESTRAGETSDIDSPSALSEADLHEFERSAREQVGLDEPELPSTPSQRDLARLELDAGDEIGLEPAELVRMNEAQPTPLSSLDGNDLPDVEIDQRVDQIAEALQRDMDASGDPHDFTSDFDLDEVMGTGAIDQAVAEAGIHSDDIDAELSSIEMALDVEASSDTLNQPVELDAQTSDDELSFDNAPQMPFNEALANELEDSSAAMASTPDATDSRAELLDFPAADDLFAQEETNDTLVRQQDEHAPLEEAMSSTFDSRDSSPDDAAAPGSESVASQDSVDELLADLAAESERRSPKDEIDAGAGIPVSHSASYTADLDWIDDVVRSDEPEPEVPDVTKRVEPNIPAPAVGGMITGTLDAGGYRTYSLFARADGHWQAVNQGNSYSALGLTFPWLLYRKLYVNALLYALLWIVSLTGLVITGLAWLDSSDQGGTMVPLLAVGFGLLAFLGLIYVPFRHANKWRMAKLAERGFEKVGEVQSINASRALKVMQNQLAMVRQRH